MLITAIDPGTAESAFVVLDSVGRIMKHGKESNEWLIERLPAWSRNYAPSVLAIEHIAYAGAHAGQEVFDTAWWGGRFVQAWGGANFTRIKRNEVKLHVIGKLRCKDKHIRAAMVTRYGPSAKEAIGTKRAPGPCYGFAGDQWQALAVGVTYLDRTLAQNSASEPAAGVTSSPARRARRTAKRAPAQAGELQRGAQ
jgi:hypothetical protein